jgi:hypothetical protein
VRKCYLIELETGTQAPVVIREKIRSLALFLDKGYHDIFTSSEGVFSGYLFFALGMHEHLTADDHRKMILKAAATELRELNRNHYAPAFKVTALHPSDPAIFDSQCCAPQRLRLPRFDVGIGHFCLGFIPSAVDAGNPILREPVRGTIASAHT